MPPLEIAHELDAVREEWQALGERSGNVFATWEWASAWWPHFGHGTLLLALHRDDAGAPTALVPLELRRWGPLRVARFIGPGPADELGPIGGAEALGELQGERLWDVLLAERLPPGAG